ncbi:hypothetical protein FPZ12_027715 [Amycolatopsis acidicola]|uniref:Uncharacterized protein n=1 Tax=Amycolatopsis acidicola TaxID=2596893 RepID=A0A5N0UW23_9PSEU|nr:hypothetical protein [Amycolatopsis acidicola]KAA9156310.1 hypothetical protein FPZ12_027715 [Amycolatopsis acidicola]
MRWTLLYARSRQIPVAALALVVCAFAVWAPARGSWSALYAALALAAGIAVCATGLSGQDPELDRTAAIRWPLRRLAHVVLVGVAAGAVLLAVQEIGAAQVAFSLVARDSAGLLGLAALAATAFGGQFGWTLPLVWFAIGAFTPQDGSVKAKLVSWMLQPAGTPEATWTAAVLGAAGLLAYSLRGGRR